MKSLFTKVMAWLLTMGLVGMIVGCVNAIPPLDDQNNQNTNYVPCINDNQCKDDQTCDKSQCLSCCPNSSGPCIDLCCGKCTEPASQIECKTDADCKQGSEWCENGKCIPCDNSGAVCKIYCLNGMIAPRNGCQPCVCNPNYVPCYFGGIQCKEGQVCDQTECLSCCPGSTGACIALCCGKCVSAPAGCKTDADCTHGFVCEPTSPGQCDDDSKRCVPGCRQESDCDANQTCNTLYCLTCPCPGQCQTKPNCTDQTYSRACKVDADCTCGVNVLTKDCDYGIATCIDESQQCPDFCTGIAGNLEIVCKDNQCIQVQKPVSACKTDADCKYGAEWCENGKCVPCDNSGLVCTIACLLVEPRNGCQPCKCRTSYTPCTGVDQCSPGEKCDTSECLSCCPGSQGACIDLCCGKCIGGFCGWSTNGPCSIDSDCMIGGCSGQVCQSKSEEPIVTTCEWTDCYDAQAYGVSCGCIAGKCQWK